MIVKIKDHSRISEKSKILQFFCKHTNTGWFEEEQEFFSPSGEPLHCICKDCGKYIETRFVENE